MRVAFEEFQRRETHDATRHTRTKKHFMLLLRMLLSRPRRGGHFRGHQRSRNPSISAHGLAQTPKDWQPAPEVWTSRPEGGRHSKVPRRHMGRERTLAALPAPREAISAAQKAATNPMSTVRHRDTSLCWCFCDSIGGSTPSLPCFFLMRRTHPNR